MSDYRKIGEKTIGTVLGLPLNVKIIEDAVWKASGGDKDVYNRVLYQTIGDIIRKEKLTNVLSKLKSLKVGWEHSSYDVERAMIDEQDDFIQNPFEVEEGVINCRCGSKKVFSCSLQSRSCDEGTSIRAQCSVCNAKWTCSG